jgi:CheY-like chemotaxis protein
MKDDVKPQAASEDFQALPPGLEVLIVEDDPLVSQVAVAFLVRLGCATSVAASAEQALERLASDGPVDVLMTDICLGAGMRGTELARIVAERFPGIAVLLVSGYSADPLDDDESPPGAERVCKPYRREELARALRRALANAKRVR